MISWGSKVGTLPPCWNLLAWVGLGTPCEQALSFLPISHHHGPMLLLKRSCKISGWNCLSVEGDWCPDDFFQTRQIIHWQRAFIHPPSTAVSKRLNGDGWKSSTSFPTLAADAQLHVGALASSSPIRCIRLLPLLGVPGDQLVQFLRRLVLVEIQSSSSFRLFNN